METYSISDNFRLFSYPGSPLWRIFCNCNILSIAPQFVRSIWRRQAGHAWKLSLSGQSEVRVQASSPRCAHLKRLVKLLTGAASRCNPLHPLNPGGIVDSGLKAGNKNQNKGNDDSPEA